VEIQHITAKHAALAPPRTPKRFWKAQFAPVPTRPQITFDVIFGIVAPVLCFVFEPIVFRSGFGSALFPDYQTFAYLFSGGEILLLSFWLVTGAGFSVWNRMMGGVFFAGAAFCATAGIALAPYSLIGLVFGIGLFGFTPFLSALVYLRNGLRAVRAGNGDAVKLKPNTATVSGFLLVLGLPLLLSLQIRLAVESATSEILEGDSAHAIFAAHRLVPLRFFAEPELDRIALAYTSEPDEQRKLLLKTCYREITGDDIENRVAIPRD
jgi:hypothetical protein